MSVSIVMPAKNAGRFIRQAIESALAQENVCRIVVVDDGSTDRTRDIVAAIASDKVVLIDNQRAGVSGARNCGAAATDSKWLMFLDADDRLRPGAVRALLQGAAASPNAIAVYGDYDRIDADGRAIGNRQLLARRSKPSGDILARLSAGNFIVNGGVMIVRADAFKALGGFDESLRYCEDWHCWCKLAALGDVQFVRETVLDYRVHGDNTMNPTIRSPADFLPAAERVFSDDAVLKRLRRDEVASLRQAAEAHLITYAATQALRYRHYATSLRYTIAALRRSPRTAPRTAIRLGLASIGI